MSNMKKKVSDFVEFEESNNLYQKEIHGLKFWTYVRFSVFWSLFTDQIFDGREVSIFKLIFKYTLSFFQGLYNLLKLSNKKYDLVFINTSGRTNTIDNKNVDIYTYPIIKQLSDKYKILLMDVTKYDNCKEYPCDFLPMRFVSIFHRVFSRILKLTEEEENYLDKLNINKLFSNEVNISQIVSTEIKHHKINYKIYKTILKRLSPKVLFYTNNGVMGGVIQAANELGIKTIELQHGEISHLHVAYNSEKFDDKVIPKYLFTFGRYWHETIKFRSEKIAVGFPYMEFMQEKLSENIARKENAIVVISQGKLGRDLFIKITIEILENLKDCEIYYKLNPSECNDWKEFYPSSFQSLANIKMIDNNDKPLYYYFRKAKYLIGSGSTCLYEGLVNDMIVFNVKSNFSANTTKLIDEKAMFVVQDAQEILSKIKSKKVPLGKINKEDMFKSNSLINVEQAVEQILQ